MSQNNLKAARAKIEAVLKEHDLAGFVTLHGPGWSEVFWSLWPSYSVIKGDFPSVRIVSKAADYKSPKDQEFAQAMTAEMVHSLGITMAECSLQFLELSEIVDAKFGTVHNDNGFVPDPSKLNPGTH